MPFLHPTPPNLVTRQEVGGIRKHRRPEAYVTTERQPIKALSTDLLARPNSNEAFGPIILIELAGVEVEAVRFITEAR